MVEYEVELRVYVNVEADTKEEAEAIAYDNVGVIDEDEGIEFISLDVERVGGL